MIKRIIELKNIGRFENIKSAQGNEGEFAKINVVYAPNACGKTTLCDVFRSLGSKNPAYIIGRKRIGSTSSSSIDILSSNNSRWLFNNGQWSSVSDCPPIFIYDERFVKENVLIGRQIGSEQKRNIYSLALGQKAIELNEAVQKAGEKLTLATKTVDTCETELLKLLPRRYQIDTYRNLPQIEDIDIKIQELKKRIETEQNKKLKADKIRKHGVLKEITIPSIQKNDLICVLSTSLDNIALIAETKIKEHLNKCTDTKKVSFGWLKQGYEAQTGDICPYCGQTISNIDLVATYKNFFSGELKEQEKQINIVKQNFQKFLDKEAQHRLSNIIKQNSADLDWWKDACELFLELPMLSDNELINAYSNVLNIALTALERKTNNLTSPISLREDETCIIDSLVSDISLILEYNSAIKNANRKIIEFQNSIDVINISELTNSLEDLEIRKERYTEKVINAYKKYDEALDLKAQAQSAKTIANEDLKQESVSIFNTFGLKINEILTSFGVNFSVETCGVNLRGGAASGQLVIKINVNNYTSNVDCSSEAAENPSCMSLANTLSGGDCSALGLAFFLAKLEIDVNLVSSIVIVDDPYHDQDRSRQAQTITLLKRKANECSQFFLFSHNLEFAQLFMADKGIARGDIRTFKIPQLNNLVEFKQDELPPGPSKSYEIDYLELSSYKSNPTKYQNQLKEVCGRIRPLLETYLHYKYPSSWGDKQWLGDMIQKIRNSHPDDVFNSCNCLLNDLEEVNDYTQRFHHRVNGISADIPDPIELLTYVQKALSIIHHA